jgi:hypothetical protein
MSKLLHTETSKDTMDCCLVSLIYISIALEKTISPPSDTDKSLIMEAIDVSHAHSNDQIILNADADIRYLNNRPRVQMMTMIIVSPFL